MRRRTFLSLMGGAAAAAWVYRPRAGAFDLSEPIGPAQAADRAEWWDPAPPPAIQPQPPFVTGVVLEWRYLAGRVTAGGQDFGFVCSIVDYRAVPGAQEARQELIVMRQDFQTGAHETTTYEGALAYDSATATYSFTAEGGAAVLSWRLITAGAERYTLSLTSPELTLSDLTLSPVGELIAEGGDGDISSGSLGGSSVRSDYYADWVEIEQGGTRVGFARLDMQTIRPETIGGGVGGFSHHWFALAGTLSNATPFWVSAWEIVSGGATVWGATIARNTANGWAVESFTEEAPAEASALAVQIIDWQAQPDSAGRRTGQRWRLSLGKVQPADQLDLFLAVPPGQFITGTRVGSTASAPMQEAVGREAAGRVLGLEIATISFVVAESTYSELGQPGTATPTTVAATPTATGTPTSTATATGTTTGATATATGTPATPTATGTAGPPEERVIYLPELEQ